MGRPEVQGGAEESAFSPEQDNLTELQLRVAGVASILQMDRRALRQGQRFDSLRESLIELRLCSAGAY